MSDTIITVRNVRNADGWLELISKLGNSVRLRLLYTIRICWFCLVCCPFDVALRSAHRFRPAPSLALPFALRSKYHNRHNSRATRPADNMDACICFVADMAPKHGGNYVHDLCARYNVVAVHCVDRIRSHVLLTLLPSICYVNWFMAVDHVWSGRKFKAYEQTCIHGNIDWFGGMLRRGSHFWSCFLVKTH